MRRRAPTVVHRGEVEVGCADHGRPCRCRLGFGAAEQQAQSGTVSTLLGSSWRTEVVLCVLCSALALRNNGPKVNGVGEPSAVHARHIHVRRWTERARTHGGGGGTDPPDEEERLRLSRQIFSDHWPSSIPPSFSRRHITWHDGSVGGVAYADGVQRAAVCDECARGFAQLGGGQ